MQSTTQMPKRAALAGILSVVVVVAVLCVVDLNDNAQEFVASEVAESRIKVTKTALGTDKRDTAFYHDPAFPAGVKDGIFPLDTDPAMNKKGVEIREDDEAAEEQEVADAAKSKKKSKQRTKLLPYTNPDNDGEFFNGKSRSGHKKTSHYKTALKKFNSVGSIWKVAEAALDDYEARKKKFAKKNSGKVEASDLEQYLSGTRPKLGKIVLPKGDRMMKAAHKAGSKGAKAVPVTDYVEVKMTRKNPYTDLSHPAEGAKHQKKKAEAQKAKEEAKKKKKEDKFPKQDFRDPVIKKGNQDPAFGKRADTAFTNSAVNWFRHL